MNRFESVTRPLMWFMALLLVAVATGCSKGSDPILGGGGMGAVTATSKAITAYSLAGPAGSIAGTIDESTRTIAVTVPYLTNVTNLVATFATTGKSVKVGTLQQTNGSTANDFTNPVNYTVTAANATTATYKVTVAVALITDKAITAYSLAGVTGTITGTASPYAIAVTLPNGTNVTALVATYTTTGTGVTVGGATQTSGTTANNFTNPVPYVVTAGDGLKATYTVTVTLAAASAKAITAYSFVGFSETGTINELPNPKTIAVAVPYGTDLTALVATYTTTGTGVKVVAKTQISGSTPNSFSSPVTYSVTAADNTTASYVVTVTPGSRVILGLATPFGMATTAGITNTTTAPITHIEGDVVLSGSSITCNAVTAPGGAGQPGFGLCGSNSSTPFINGTVITPTYPDTTTATAVVNDLKAAFLSITPPAGPPAAGSLGGATNLPAGTTLGNVSGSALVQGDNYFVAGVYQSLTSIMITGDLTLDAKGDPNASFIFQSSSTVGTADGAAGGVAGTFTRILLVNGAKASNVWWQAATSATLGLYSEFQGNILSSASITMKTGATSCGRLLAGAFTAGAFVFDANVVSVPGRPFAPPLGYSTTCQ